MVMTFIKDKCFHKTAKWVIPFGHAHTLPVHLPIGLSAVHSLYSVVGSNSRETTEQKKNKGKYLRNKGKEKMDDHQT